MKNSVGIVELAEGYQPLRCEVCNQDLLKAGSGVLGLPHNLVGDTYHVVEAYWACKGECDEKMRNRYEAQGYSTSLYEQLEDLINPLEYGAFYVRMLMRLYSRDEYIYEKEALGKIALGAWKASQAVIRKPTSQEELRSYVYRSMM